MNTSSYTISSKDDPSLLSTPPCGTIVSNIWENESDIKQIYDAITSLDDWSLCGDSIQNYVVKFALDACKFYER
jgi:hypothetical protein